MDYGINTVFAGCLSATLFVLLSVLITLPKSLLIIALLTSQVVLSFGGSMVTGNALALALIEYKWCIGTASSLFGFFYYCGIALVTLGMGTLHNGTILPMPFFFLAISALMIVVRKTLLS